MERQIQVIVASLPATRERVKIKLKELGLKDVATKEYVCQECDGQCFISDGTYKGASEEGKKENRYTMILCETCAGKHLKGNLELHIPDAQIKEIEDTFK